MVRDFWTQVSDRWWVSAFDSFDSRPLEFSDFDRSRGDILETSHRVRAC